MRKLYPLLLSAGVAIAVIALHSCHSGQAAPSKAAIDAIDLKRGPVISCGAPGKQYGSLTFETSCADSVKPDFELAIEMLHSFEYDEAEKVFAKIIDKSPECAMAYWGVAMCNFHALWTPPSEAELVKGNRAIAVAQSIHNKTARETAYIDALAAFYSDWQHRDHMTRANAFEQAMGKLHADYPADKEAAIFYALSLDAAASPTDKSYAKQKKAGDILEALYPGEPNHPGVIHYIIHSYDYPGLAIKALPAAKHYAEVAPSSAHALHMPSHIFTRLGMWDECIASNQASVSSARCYAEATGIKGHWDEEMHGLDYIIYAYLQKGRDDSARMELQYVDGIQQVSPMNFKVAFAFAAIPSRYVLENHSWKEAAVLPLQPSFVPWKNFPWQEAMIRYTRTLGWAHTGKIDSAKAELQRLYVLRDTLLREKDMYKVKKVNIAIKTAEAWTAFQSGQSAQALADMTLAANMEDSTEKHPVTPGELLPARELLGDMLMAMQQPAKALEAYELQLQKTPNRFNGVYGAALAAEKSGNKEKALQYYKQLIAIAPGAGTMRPELNIAAAYLRKAASRKPQAASTFASQ